MIKKVFIFLLFVVFVVGVYAKPRALQEATLIAEKFVPTQIQNGSLKKTAAIKANVQLAYTSYANSQPCFYVFNRTQNNGFVIVSADDRAKQILGYTDEGNFDVDNMPDNLRDWLHFYQEELAVLADQPESDNTSKVLSVTDTSQKSAAAISAVSPLLKSKWGQGDPYNLFCPIYKDSTRSVVGCVATAMAQVMYYHQWPVTGTGASEAYTTETNKLSIPSVDFSATTYDWANMTTTYSSSSTDPAKNAVATLMYHCGVSVGMDYGKSSGASTKNICTALKTYFDYDDDMQYVYRAYYTKAEWVELLMNELNASRPVVYRGSSEGGGHAFVCDGYDANGLFHFNWGWTGLYNGYFELSALTPGTDGIGAGTADGYNQYQSMAIGIQKETESVASTIYQIVIDTVPVSSVASTTRSGVFDISVHGLWNLDLRDFSGKLALVLYQNGTFLQVLKDRTTDPLGTYKGWTSYVASGISIPNTVADGDYQLYFAYKSTDASEWSIIRGLVGTPNYLNVNISASAITFSEATEAYPNLSLSNLKVVGNLYQNEIGRYSCSITNTGGEYASLMAIYLESVSDNTVYQLGTSNPISIASNETRTVTLNDSVKLDPGNYYLYVMYDPANNSNEIASFYSLGDSIQVTILAEPTENPVLKLAAQPAFSNNDSVPKQGASLMVNITNTGGYFHNDVIAYIYSDVNPLTSYFGYQAVYIDKNDTISVTFSGDIDLDSGSYKLVLYYWDETANKWMRFSPYSWSIVTFTLVETPTGVITNLADGFSLYFSVAGETLHLSSAEKMQSVRVVDVTGKQVYFSTPDIAGDLEISLSQITTGVYILQVETEKGVVVRKFVKP